MPSARRGSGTASSSPSSGANAVTATSTSVAAPRVKVPPIGEADFPTSAAVLPGPVAPSTHQTPVQFERCGLRGRASHLRRRWNGSLSTPVMLHVDYARWDQTPEDLRRLATSAAHQRTRERFLALYEITQESCATRGSRRVCADTRRP